MNKRVFVKVSFKLFVLTFLFVAVLASYEEKIHGDNECQTRCANSQTLCLADAQDAYDSCEFNAETSQWSCFTQSEADYDNCVNDTCPNKYPWATNCPEWCQDQKNQRDQVCVDQYISAVDNCWNTKWNANESCYTVYRACYNACPP